MIVSADIKGTLDHPACNLLRGINTFIPMIPLSMFNDYEFNPELYNLDKYLLFDFCEYGANDWDMKDTHIWGVNSYKFPQTQITEWKKFDNFIQEKPPTVYFKRELLEKDFNNNIYPVEYPCLHPKYPAQSKREFNSRPIQVFFSWGHSHESRRVLHGNIFVNAAKKGYGVIDNFSYIDRGTKEYSDIWVTINSPHYARISIEEVLEVNGKSKLSVSLPGAGIKCFRHSESPVNSVMVMREDNLAWSHQWIDGVNCITIPLSSNHFGEYDMDEIRGVSGGQKVIRTIEEALQRTDLYHIYLNGLENLDKYRLERYCKETIEPIINSYL